MSEDNVILDRRGENVSLPQSGISCKITTGETALSVLGTNPVQHGDDFRDDGYVYGPDGEIRRKRFKEFYGYGPRFSYWHPKLKDIKSIEAARYKAYVKYQDSIRTLWKEMFKELKGKVVLGMHEDKEIFIDTSDRGLSWGYMEYSEIWSDQERVRDQDLVDLHFAVEKRMNDLRRRFQIFNQIFELAIRAEYFSDYPDQALLKLSVNNRTYWIEFVRGRHDFKFRILNEVDNVREGVIE